ncbi:hypothetical protein D3C84_1027320 [compost metagenome]
MDITVIMPIVLRLEKLPRKLKNFCRLLKNLFMLESENLKLEIVWKMLEMRFKNIQNLTVTE